MCYRTCHTKFAPFHSQNASPLNQNSNQIGSPGTNLVAVIVPLTVLVPPSLNYLYVYDCVRYK